jgi:hypothetical protein
LKGLWHKHYLPDGIQEFAKNIKRALKLYGISYIKQRVEDAKQSGTVQCFCLEDAEYIARSAVSENWEQMKSRTELTGQWIIYAIFEDINYYLCLGDHDKSTHIQLRRQIEAICFHEFTFLNQMIGS